VLNYIGLLVGAGNETTTRLIGWTGKALDEVLKRFPTWAVDWDNAVQARTSTVRGWEKLPVVTT
jgi:cytochrome P450